MKTFLMALLALAFLPTLSMPAMADTGHPGVRTPDPAAFADTVSRQMQTQGMQPIRATFDQMFSPSGNAPLPASIEAFLVTWERAVSGKRTIVSRKLDDVTIGDAARSIYQYHYYGDNAWIFVRFDFVRISESSWALSALTLEDQWYKIAQTISPTAGR